MKRQDAQRCQTGCKLSFLRKRQSRFPTNLIARIGGFRGDDNGAKFRLKIRLFYMRLKSGVLQNGLVQVFVHGTGPSKIP